MRNPLEKWGLIGTILSIVVFLLAIPLDEQFFFLVGIVGLLVCLLVFAVGRMLPDAKPGPVIPGFPVGQTHTQPINQPTGACANCGQVIGRLETPHVWREQIVCEACHRRLSRQ